MRNLALLVLGAAMLSLPGAASATSLIDRDGFASNVGWNSWGDPHLGLLSGVSAIDAFGISIDDGGGKYASSFFGGSLFGSFFHHPFYIFDFKHFKTHCSPPIPEPSAAAVFGVGALMIAATTRRRTRS